MVTPPGAAGYTLMGDKSVPIYNDIIRFVRQQLEKHGQPVFTSRFLNKSTVFLTSSEGVRQLLSDENSHCFQMGYKKYLHRFFGDALIFENGEAADRLRELLKDKFCHSSLESNQFHNTLEKHTASLLETIEEANGEVSIYNLSKELSVNTGLEFFLDLDVGSDGKLAHNMNKLTSTHFKGITSVPVDIKVPFSSYSSTYSKSIVAKEKLTEIIESKLVASKQACKPSFPQSIVETESGEEYHATSHLLLLLCSIVPKSLASLISSFVIALAGYDKCEMRNRALTDDMFFEAAYKEVMRLWPPLVAGRREVVRDCTLDGYKVCEGQAVLYVSYLAHRDKTMFKNPEQFIPERWLDPKSDEVALFALGGGSRCCIGTHYVFGLIKHVMRSLLVRYDWRLKNENSDLNYKWIPVLRPKNDVRVIFKIKQKDHTIP